MKVTIEMERGQLQEIVQLIGDRQATLVEQKGLTSRERALLTTHYEKLRSTLRPAAVKRAEVLEGVGD